MSFMTYELEGLVGENHILKQVEEVVPFGSLAYLLKDLETRLGRKGYGAECGMRCLYLQFHYDLSDRELEEHIRDSIAFRWFCGFEIDDETPDHSFFCRMRKVIGTKRIGKIFKVIVNRAEDKNIVRNVFKFVDSTKIVSKETTWAERDKAKKDGVDTLNNQNISKYAADDQARFGCKGKNDYWYGYKEHISADMSSMLIDKIAVTPAHIPDGKAFKHVSPRNPVMIFGDKAYSTKEPTQEMVSRDCYSAAIQKNNMASKNRDLDRWRSKVRAPFECIFSKFEKRARYRGNAKVQMQAFMDATVWNIKRLITLNAPPLFASA